MKLIIVLLWFALIVFLTFNFSGCEDEPREIEYSESIEPIFSWIDPNESYFEIYLDTNDVVQVETRNCSLSEAAEMLFDKVKEQGN